MTIKKTGLLQKAFNTVLDTFGINTNPHKVSCTKRESAQTPAKRIIGKLKQEKPELYKKIFSPKNDDAIPPNIRLRARELFGDASPNNPICVDEGTGRVYAKNNPSEIRGYVKITESFGAPRNNR